MKKFFVIETDTEMYSVFVYEVEQSFSDQVNYVREAGIRAVVHESPGPKFYGKLDSLLITRNTLENAAPITPEIKVQS